MVLTLKFVPEGKDSFKSILRLIKKSKKKVCYITLNKTADSLKDSFKKGKINTGRFYFVDCITMGIKKPKKTDNCDFIAAPHFLDEISDSIKKAIKKNHTLVIFDSLSNLLVHGLFISTGDNIEFIKSFLPELEKKKGDAIFICKLKDKENILIKEIIPIFDKIRGNKKIS